MKPLDRAAAVAFLVSGGLLVAWGMFSLLGTLVGGVMSAAAVAMWDEELLIGVPVFLIYGLWVLICLVVGPIQLLAGVRMMRGEPNNRLTWAAAFGGLAGAATFYCAPPALISFALGLGALLSEEEAG